MQDAIPVTAARPRTVIDFHDGGAWIVQAGHVDCFAIEPHAIEEAGRRRPLFTVAEGAVILSIDAPPGGIRLVAVPSLGCRWASLELPPTVEQRAAWARRLLRATLPPLPDQLDRTEPATTLVLPAAGRLAVGRGVAALSVESGRIRLGGVMAWGPDDGPLLATEPLWLDSDAGARLTFVSDSEGDRAAIAGLHRLTLAAIVHLLDTGSEAERVRLTLRAARETSAIANSLRLLADIGVKSRMRAAGTGATDPVSIALAPVLQHLGMPPLAGVAEPTVERTLEARSMRCREVLLRPGWQGASAEPLIAFLGADRLPVALLPGRHWRVVGAGIDEPLHSDIEARLQLDALQVYRSFPPGSSRFQALLALGTRGGTPDALRAIGLALLASIGALAVPAAMSSIFDGVIPNGDVAGLWTLIAVLIVAAIASGGFAIANALALLRIETRFEVNSSPALMDRLLRLPVKFFRSYSVGDLVDRLLGIQRARVLLSASLSIILFGGIFALTSLVLLLSYSLFVGGIAFLLAGMLAGITVAIARVQRRLSNANLLETGRLDGFVLQLITGIAKLRGAAAERRAMVSWSTRFAVIAGRSARVRQLGAFQQMLDNSLPPIAVAVMYLAISRDSLHLSTGDVVTIAAAFAQLLAALMALARATNQLAQAVPLVDRARPLLETLPEARPDAEPIGRLEGTIALRNVAFRYSDAGPLIVDNVSLDIPAGSFVAFVGPSGSGKSTILRLLLGFETPNAGEVLFDGRVADRIDPNSLRRQIGVVLQNGQIFSGSIFDNILGPAAASMGEAWAAARMVGLDRDIEDMPMGMHTVLLDGGGTLSGGQRQRILIARALAYRPRILLFDEATSALDNRTQAVVTETLAKLSITRVVIAHRLSTITDVDRIFVVDRGRLVQQGGYAELLDCPGPFADLARRQMSQ